MAATLRMPGARERAQRGERESQRGCDGFAFLGVQERGQADRMPVLHQRQVQPAVGGHGGLQAGEEGDQRRSERVVVEADTAAQV